MRFLRFGILVAIAAGAVSIPFLKSTAVNPAMVSVIVQLRDDPAAVYQAKVQKTGASVSNDQLQAYRNQISAKQDQFLTALTSKGVVYTVVSRNVKNFDGSLAATVPLRYTLVFNGMALTVPNTAIETIRAMPNVKSVRPDAQMRTSLNNSVKYIRAPEVYNRSEEEASSQFYTGAPDSIVGTGVNVAVIDTGVDWTHPMFGGDPTPPRLAVLPPGATQSKTNQKVIYYLPLADVVAEDTFGHGTHVAATAAGYLAQTPDGTRIHGVAPQAKIMAYKVCSDVEVDVYEVSQVPVGGICDTSNIIMALEDSVSPFSLPTVQGTANPASALLPKPIAHVINMSLGGFGGPDEPAAIAASNAALAGAIVLAASGNSGPGDATSGSPAAGTHVISVAATTHPGNVASSFQANVVGGPQGMTATLLGGSATPPENLTNNYVFCGFADTPDQVPDTVSGRIALAVRGSTVDAGDSGSGAFANKAAQAAAKGAIALIVYNNVDGELEGATTYASTIPVFGLSKTNGELLKSLIGSDAAGAVSAKQVNIGHSTSSFMGNIASFSSRGPILGFGQVKPDVAAPGVQVLAACPPASVLGALAAADNPTSPNYIRIDGTSMATPHMAGAAALLRQAHPNWSADVVRTVFMNTATNMRGTGGAVKADGTGADSIIAQGGGLVDVYHAVNAKALMGVVGDGIDKPSILGSHSFGEVSVANSRTTFTAPIEVTVRDISGQGGVYNLNVANNRDLQIAGINVTLSQASVNVGPNGSATFTLTASFDGNLLRDFNTVEVNGNSVTFRPIQMQWYVTAQRNDGGESLRMPFYFKPNLSVPAQPIVESSSQTVTVPVGGFQQKLQSGADYMDVPFEVSANTYNIEARSEWFDLPTGKYQDLDYNLLDPDGNVLAVSQNIPGHEEFVSVRITRPGTYTHRLIGVMNGGTNVTITTKLSKGPLGPAAQPIAGDFANSQGQQIDFDGNVNVSWTPAGGETGFEIESLTPGNSDWQLVADVAAGTTSYAFTNLANGVNSFRVRGIHPGQIGSYFTLPGAVTSVTVDPRSKVDITNQVTKAVSNVSLSGGVFQLDLSFASNATQTYVPLVDLNVVGITSGTNTVKVINADNGKDGKSPANAALFGYSQKIGADEVFTPSEVTGTRTFRFQDSASEMFSFDAIVTAYVSAGGGGSSSSSTSSTGESQSTTSGGGGTGSLAPLTRITAVMRFTANPLTRSVTSQLITLK